MIRVHLQGGVTFTGKAVDTIARREFGPKAFYRESQNPNDVAVGKFLVPTEINPHEYWTVGIVMQVEEIQP